MCQQRQVSKEMNVHLTDLTLTQSFMNFWETKDVSVTQ